MRWALALLSLLIPGGPVSAAKTAREIVRSVQLDLAFDAPLRDAIAVSREPGALAANLAENPLEVGALSPRLAPTGEDDPVRRAALTGRPDEYLRALRATDRQAPEDDEVQQRLARQALEQEAADREWSRLSLERRRLAGFRDSAERIARVASIENAFDGTGMKREALINFNVRSVRGARDKSTGRATWIPIEDATPFQVGQVFKTYYQALKRREK